MSLSSCYGEPSFHRQQPSAIFIRRKKCNPSFFLPFLHRSIIDSLKSRHVEARLTLIIFCSRYWIQLITSPDKSHISLRKKKSWTRRQDKDVRGAAGSQGKHRRKLKSAVFSLEKRGNAFNGRRTGRTSDLLIPLASSPTSPLVVGGNIGRCSLSMRGANKIGSASICMQIVGSARLMHPASCVLHLSRGIPVEHYTPDNF